MKPSSKRKQNIIHACVWIIICLLPVHLFFSNIHFDSRLLAVSLSRVIVFFIVFYSNYSYLIDKYLLNRRIFEHIVINLLLIFILSIGLYYLDKTMIAPVMENLVKGPHFFRPKSFGMRILGDVFSTFILVTGLSTGVKILQKYFEDNAKLKELQAEQAEAELKQLKSQINPHFLFNTLNNIYSLVAIDKEKAQKAIHKLSFLLRYTLYDNKEFVPLNKELDFIRNYIDLMKLRLSNNIRLTVDIDDGNSEDTIAPLVFITIIENAFKHGISNINSSFINIQIDVQRGTKISCRVENSCYPAEIEDRSGSGIGLKNISRRLEILYPDKHVFKSEKTAQHIFSACIEIDLTTNSAKKNETQMYHR